MNELQREKIWDPVTRLWHWVLAFSVAVAWSFGTFMTFDNVRWHFYLGYLILGLMAFRLLWGLVGPRPVRWASLIPRPSAVRDYLRSLKKRQPGGAPGHNPLGSLSVIVMVGALIGQGFSGLFIEAEDFFEYAPLNGDVSKSTVKLMSSWHHTLSDVILVLVILHVTAIFVHLFWKRENLITPMITGWKWVRRQ